MADEARFPPHPLVAVQPLWAAQDITVAASWINMLTIRQAIERGAREEGAEAPMWDESRSAHLAVGEDSRECGPKA